MPFGMTKNTGQARPRRETIQILEVMGLKRKVNRKIST